MGDGLNEYYINKKHLWKLLEGIRVCLTTGKKSINILVFLKIKVSYKPNKEKEGWRLRGILSDPVCLFYEEFQVYEELNN